MPLGVISPRYFKEYLEKTLRVVREQDQSGSMSDIVRETESRISDLEEEEHSNVKRRPSLGEPDSRGA